MMQLQSSPALLLVASLLAALPVSADGLYTKKSPVLQVDAKTYDQHIANSNYPSIVEFYAPWCGHCQNLKPAYEKAAKNLDGLAKVAAVNCDDDTNKPLCGRLGVQGFPTLKIMTPSKKPGKPRVEDYQGARSAKAIVDAVVDRIPNHVKKVTDKDLDGWLSEDEESPKALLFTEKGTTSALIRALAIDFLDSIKVGQVRSKESDAVEKFEVESFPTLVLLPGEGKDPIVYDGELKKQPMVEFLSQAAAPNQDPAPAKSKSSKSTKATKSAESSSKPTQSTESKAADDEDNDNAQEKPAAQPPVQSHTIDTLASAEALDSACLMPKSGTCVLALVPESSESGPAQEALASLAEIAHKHALRQTKLFPFYSVPSTNDKAQSLRDGLGLSADATEVEIIAVNGRRGWWRRYDGSAAYGQKAVETWIDAIRLGEGSKSKLPEGIVGAAKEEAAADHDEL
ncbi:putative disulfide isomerase [Aspergillus candidus]|uniref:protein disulfide-isomerase n=1 Tax=Aspergillus candidus TaxID=41067 RepID=A0A2I2FLA9_ASPCN|nr:thioredoxin-domain-containing protein [Aspergillus candidus]PLB41427.1 thioredoxin-domain-containing protein [Aspergillus candidus]